MDATTMRAEIKAWERAFRQSHQREPTIQDIKEQPTIADKYKLYKKLNKSLATKKHQEPLSTPPRRTPASLCHSSILPKSRATPSAISPSGTNPFSPIKSKGKQASQLNTSANGEPAKNPFVTPIKRNAKILDTPREQSPDSFPLIPSLQQASSSQEVPVEPFVSKARKRLRGDPVSPSPRRNDKKRRTAEPHSSSTNVDLNGDERSTCEDALDDLNHSYVDDSPAKPPAGGKDFKLLFRESHGAYDEKLQADPLFPTSRPGLFPAKGNLKRVSSVSSMDWSDDESESSSQVKRMAFKDKIPGRASKDGKTKSIVPRGIIACTDDMDLDRIPFSNHKHGKNRDEISQSIATNRTHPDFDTDVKPPNDKQIAPNTHLTLLPPSPPPAASSSKLAHYGKGGGKGLSQKKARLEAGLGQPDDSLEDNDDEIADWNPQARLRSRAPAASLLISNPTADMDGWDSDPVLRLDSRRVHPPVNNFTDDEGDDEGAFEVDLPDHLREMLALSPSYERDREEKGIVKGILYGSRAVRHSGAKGGEVWDAGEIDDPAGGEDQAEDDWAGEGVPWEVGEL